MAKGIKIKGGNNNAALLGTTNDDDIESLFGVHTIDAGAGNDDIKIGNTNGNVVYAGEGNDRVSVGDGNDTIYGGAGNDVVTTGRGDSDIDGGTGDDVITVGNGRNRVLGGDGNDILRAGRGNNYVDGGQGDDRITVGDGRNSIVGGSGNDDIRAGDGGNTIAGNDGNDTIRTGAGTDLLDGGAGNDTLNSGDGDDWVFGGAGKDSIDGDKGTDTLDGGEGDDTLTGGAGNDTLLGSSGDDLLLGDGSFDGGGRLRSASGGGASGKSVFRDYLEGGAGNDRLFAEKGNDVASYSVAENIGAHDTYDGGSGVDTLALRLGNPQWFNPQFQADLASYLVFLKAHTNARTGETDNAVFQFKTFDLKASAFENVVPYVEGRALDPRDEAVIARTDNVTTDEDHAKSFASVLANDVVPDLARTVELLSGPAQGVLTFNPGTSGNPDGSFTYDPHSAFEYLREDQSATVSFTYRVTDADGDSDVGTARMAIAGVNDAPLARNDAYAFFEGGQAGMNSPSHVPAGKQLLLLANDTDVENNTLEIVGFSAAGHGTVQIVDGPDLDSRPGDAVYYMPNADYAGPDGFDYTISDGHGGSAVAHASITIEAVADLPALGYQILAGASINEVVVRITATQTDADASEYIDRIELGGLPPGVTVAGGATFNPATEPGQIVQDFVLTLPAGQDSNFDLTISAISKERSNGDEQVSSVSVPIAFEHADHAFEKSFFVSDVGVFNGNAGFQDDRFLGYEGDPGSKSNGGALGYEADARDLQIGFVSHVSLTGGEIDAKLDYRFGIITDYNKTTDALQIGTSKSLLAGAFTTSALKGSFGLDVIEKYDIGINVTYDLVGHHGSIGHETIKADNSPNLFTLGSNDVNFSISDSDMGGTITFAWPGINTATTPGGPLSTSGSAAFLTVDIDVDQLLAYLANHAAGNETPIVVNPLHWHEGNSNVGATFDLADFDVVSSAALSQAFGLNPDAVAGSLQFEDGSFQNFTIGDQILLADASSHDLNHDGKIGFTLWAVPQATMTSNTDLTFTTHYNLDLLKGKAEYDFRVEGVGPHGSEHFGPIYNLDGGASTSVPLFHGTFELDFTSAVVGSV